MKIVRLAFILFAFLSGTFLADAQGTKPIEEKYALDLKQDKIIINVDSLKMSQETLISEVLSMIPELLSRDRLGMFSNFDVQIDGRSIGNAKDVILSKTRLYELSAIEVSTSPVVSQQKNGQGGVINLKPRNLKDGFQGNAFLGASTLFDLIPDVDLAYHKDKFELRAQMSLEYYRPTDVQDSYDYEFPVTRYMRDTTRNNYFQEAASLSLLYKPTEKDQLKLWLWESWDRNLITENSTATLLVNLQDPVQTETYRVFDTRSMSSNLNRAFSSTTFFEYKHIFGKDHEFLFNATCAANSSKKDDYDRGSLTSAKPLTAEGTIKYQRPFIFDADNSVLFSCGFNGSYKKDFVGAAGDHNRYLSPYMSLKFMGRKLVLDAGIRYQNYFRLYTPSPALNFQHVDNDYTWNVNILWQTAPHHALRFIANKNLIRPTDAMLFYGTGIVSSFGLYEAPNPDLKSTVIHSFEASYIHDWKVGEHGFLTNVALVYEYCDKVIERSMVFEPMLRQYRSQYVNSGINRIVSANAMFSYSYGIFSIVLTGNYFNNIINTENGRDFYSNFNFCVQPLFNFSEGWAFTVRAMYNSPVYKANALLGDCISAHIEMHKSFKNWTFSARLCDIFDYRSTDRTELENKYIVTSYDFYPRNFQLGVTYKF